MDLFNRPVSHLKEWLTPVPPKYQNLAPAFEAEAQEGMWEMFSPFMLAAGVLFAPIGLLDYVLYREEFWPLVLVRALTVGTFWFFAFVARRWHKKASIYHLTFLTGIFINLLFNLMLVLNHDPTGPYMQTVFAALIFGATMPWPAKWMLWGNSLIIVGYLAIVPVLGAVGEPGVFLLRSVPPLVGMGLLLVLVHRLLGQLRWESFLNRRRVQSLNDRLQAELALARQIQTDLLPPVRPGWSGPEVVCYSNPAREVGGDFYAYHNLSGDRFALAVGDVSGKGMPAALLMTISLALLQSSVASEEGPGGLLARLDGVISPYTSTTSQYTALCCAEITGTTMRVANAGCIYPVIRKKCGGVAWVEVVGIPLGIGLSQQPNYMEETISLSAGDLVIFTSDGVVEASDEAGRLFGFGRLEQAASAGPCESTQAMLDYLLASVNEFTGGREPEDDITIVVVKIGPRAVTSPP